MSSLCYVIIRKFILWFLQILIPSGGRNIFLGWKSYTPPIEFGFCFFEITLSPQVEQLVERKVFCQQVPLLYPLLHLTRDGKKQEIIVGLFTKCHSWDSKFGWRPRAKKTQEQKESQLRIWWQQLFQNLECLIRMVCTLQVNGVLSGWWKQWFSYQDNSLKLHRAHLNTESWFLC